MSKAGFTEQYIEYLCSVGYELWKSTLISGPPSTSARFKRMNAPQAGDIVLEITTGVIRRHDRNGIGSTIGRLKKIALEPYPLEGPWDEVVEGKPAPSEEVVYIERLDTGSEVRWTNAKFVTILPHRGWQ